MRKDYNMEVKIFNNGAQPTPEYKHKGDSGMDIRANEDVILYPFETGRMVKTGIHVKIPRGYEIQVRPRSGMSHSTKLRVSNSPGTIDSNYIGELCILCDNIGNDRIEIKTGDRIAHRKTT